MIRLISFSYRDNQVPEADMLVDCRGFKNPYSVPDLKPLTGKDRKVQQFMLKDDAFQRRCLVAVRQIKDGQTIAFGCLGGKHRSVAMAEILAGSLKVFDADVEVKHLNLA